MFIDKNKALLIEQYIDEHLNEKITIEQLAKLSYISSSTFKKFFKETYKMTLSQYIQEKKIQLATNKLLNTDLSITQIASECGYNNASKFSVFFKKVVGYTPSEFRKNKKLIENNVCA